MIYVDATKEYPPEVVAPAARHAGTRWCHLWSSENDIVELMLFAARIKLRREWCQTRYSALLGCNWHHFDVTPSRRRAAVLQGAQEMSLIKWLSERRTAAPVS